MATPGRGAIDRVAESDLNRRPQGYEPREHSEVLHSAVNPVYPPDGWHLVASRWGKGARRGSCRSRTGVRRCPRAVLTSRRTHSRPLVDQGPTKHTVSQQLEQDGTATRLAVPDCRCRETPRSLLWLTLDMLAWRSARTVGSLRDEVASLQKELAGRSEGVAQASRDAQWAAQVRWAADHFQHRIEIAGQLALGLLALQGVLVALVADTSGGGEMAVAKWLRVGSLALLVGGAVISLVGLLPRTQLSVNVRGYQSWWTRDVSGEGYPRPDAFFVEEALPSNGDVGVLEAADRVLYARLRIVRVSVVLTVGALALLASAYTVQAF